jgi:hypothetical protein
MLVTAYLNAILNYIMSFSIDLSIEVGLSDPPASIFKKSTNTITS